MSRSGKSSEPTPLRDAAQFMRRTALIHRLVAPLLLLAAPLYVTSCGAGRPSSNSVQHARDQGVLVAEYVVAAEAELGEYRPLEVWIENRGKREGPQLVVRLNGPHVDKEPRIRIDGLSLEQYRHIWSERNGPPYEVWAHPDEPPNSFVLRSGSSHIEVLRRPD